MFIADRIKVKLIKSLFGGKKSETRERFVKKLGEDLEFVKFLKPEMLREMIHQDWVVWGAPGDS